jgi:hypothetical protein
MFGMFAAPALTGGADMDAEPSRSELEADFEEVADQRRSDRRRADRRAPAMRLDPLFAATLIATLDRPPPRARGSYVSRRRTPRGLRVNLWT